MRLLHPDPVAQAILDAPLLSADDPPEQQRAYLRLLARFLGANGSTPPIQDPSGEPEVGGS